MTSYDNIWFDIMTELDNKVGWIPGIQTNTQCDIDAFVKFVFFCEKCLTSNS